ncbi:dihydrofolate reductase family protein [Roseovarius sp. EL26]|uniref:dihydrofolate reductase family protein n=1 Tax=Roseovarius sp. EL26 TaxID=2126672 RepID=UPI000EA333A0|nr:dihydrofolate reductase family protein [Roseovarius sp. EL26]
MITGHIMMAMTLDGFVARKDHSLDWLMKQNTTDEDHGFTAFMDSIDVLVMGSGSFKTVLGFDEWPYDKPVIVLSRSLTQSDIPTHLQDKVEISMLAPTALMAELESRGHKRVYVDGGAIIQSFLSDGLIESLKITTVPILIGDGIRIFSTLNADIDLRLESVTEYPSGLVTKQYSVQ